MTREDYVTALEIKLRRARVAFTRSETLSFAGQIWRPAEADPDPARWAREFLAWRALDREV